MPPSALAGRADLQSPSSLGNSLGGPISPLGLGLPMPSSGPAALNLLPIDQLSSLSAAPSGVLNPEPLRLNEGASLSTLALKGRLDRHWSTPSDTAGARSARSPGGPSKRRREPSREPERSGRGPSRRHGLSNLALSSAMDPKPLFLAARQLLNTATTSETVGTYVVRRHSRVRCVQKSSTSAVQVV